VFGVGRFTRLVVVTFPLLTNDLAHLMLLGTGFSVALQDDTQHQQRGGRDEQDRNGDGNPPPHSGSHRAHGRASIMGCGNSVEWDDPEAHRQSPASAHLRFERERITHATAAMTPTASRTIHTAVKQGSLSSAAPPPRTPPAASSGSAQQPTHPRAVSPIAERPHLLAIRPPVLRIGCTDWDGCREWHWAARVVGAGDQIVATRLQSGAQGVSHCG
jgi:hypothetical protein